MLDPTDEHTIADQFGVARTQVHRDHLISHLLAAISDHLADDILFFGGTALSRTHAPDGRLSEDIDLIALGRRRATAERLETTLVRATRREYPGLRWEPAPTTVREATPAILTSPDGLTVRVQLLSSTGYAPWPTERRALVQRYRDAPPATLIVPTARPSQLGRPSPGPIAPPPATSTTCTCSPNSARSTTRPPTSSDGTDPPTGHPPPNCSLAHPTKRPGGANSPAKPVSASPPPTPSPTSARHGVRPRTPGDDSTSP